ncbi:hypothetical protein VTO73DRAFT_5122 [Trametes versicolor]
MSALCLSKSPERTVRDQITWRMAWEGGNRSEASG